MYYMRCLFQTNATVLCPLHADMDRVEYSIRSDDGVLHNDFTGFGGRHLIIGVYVVKFLSFNKGESNAKPETLMQIIISL